MCAEAPLDQPRGDVPSTVLPRIFRATIANPSISAEFPRFLATARKHSTALANAVGTA
jgi:hypothetical protein